MATPQFEWEGMQKGGSLGDSLGGGLGSAGGMIGSAFGPVGGLIGSLGGGILGGITSLFGHKKSAAELAAEKATAINNANDPNYYAKSNINWGNALGAQQNWGLPAGEMFYSNPSKAAALFDQFDPTVANQLRNNPATEVAPGVMRRLDEGQLSDLSKRTFEKFAGPRMEQMAPMFGQQQGGFGSGGGNFGQYTGGSAPMSPDRNSRFSTMIPGA